MPNIINLIATHRPQTALIGGSCLAAGTVAALASAFFLSSWYFSLLPLGTGNLYFSASGLGAAIVFGAGGILLLVLARCVKPKKRLAVVPPSSPQEISDCERQFIDLCRRCNEALSNHINHNESNGNLNDLIEELKAYCNHTFPDGLPIPEGTILDLPKIKGHLDKIREILCCGSIKDLNENIVSIIDIYEAKVTEES